MSFPAASLRQSDREVFISVVLGFLEQGYCPLVHLLSDWLQQKGIDCSLAENCGGGVGGGGPELSMCGGMCCQFKQRVGNGQHACKKLTFFALFANKLLLKKLDKVARVY